MALNHSCEVEDLGLFWPFSLDTNPDTVALMFYDWMVKHDIQPDRTWSSGQNVHHSSLSQYVTVRTPGYSEFVSANRWHRDRGGQKLYMIVWASRQPTLVKYGDAGRGRPRKLTPLHVYRFRNDQFVHKAPPEVVANRSADRWFIRVYQAVEE